MRRHWLSGTVLGVIFLLAAPSLIESHAVSDPQPQLTVTASEVEMRYCQSYSDQFSVFLKLNLQFRNESEGKIILSRHLASPIRVRVSVSSEAFQQEKFIYEPSVMAMEAQAPKREKFGDVPDAKRFATVDSGAAFSAEAWAVLIADLTTDQRKTPRTGPTAGEFVMQVFVPTWPYSSTESELQKIATNWKPQGTLITENTASRPFSITLPKVARAVPCVRFKAPT